MYIAYCIPVSFSISKILLIGIQVSYYNPNLNLQAGALLACGIVNSGVKNECDPALALLSDYVGHSSNVMRLGSIVGYVHIQTL